jgi:hypothetical protein
MNRSASLSRLRASSPSLLILGAFVALCVAGALLGCSGDQSLGGGLPAPGDAAAAFDATDASTSLPPADAGADRSSSCNNHVGIDAGGGLLQGLILWYRCDSAAGTSAALLPDSTTYANDGLLLTGTGEAQGHHFDTGKVDNALYLSLANQGYVRMPAGLLAEACEVTIATWVYINSNVHAWMRIWDFGQDTTSYMFLTPITNLDNLARFGISVNGNTDEQGIKAQAAVPTLRWTHVALVLGPAGATLYFNGAPVGTDSSMTLRPADLGRTANNYIGRSQFSEDPYFDGAIDEFRIYNRALSPEEIQALASGS